MSTADRRGAGDAARSWAIDAAAVRWDTNGLVPAVVQDPEDGRVLMVAWMDVQALEATVSTGLVHFHSRSRDELWQKGETSGNVLRLRGLALDCDGDTLLVQASPSGPACHRGTLTCFDVAAGGSISTAGAPSQQDFRWLEELWSTIESRAATMPDGSYTALLVDGGPDLAGRKVAEEAVEVLIAAKNDAAEDGPTSATRDALAGEAADLLYHLLVLLAERDIPPAAVMGILKARHRS
jgi:phosphoribosyl-ATP pyrophosphohydrolase/phosphoribosyl-AMP cyclohydrolase